MILEMGKMEKKMEKFRYKIVVILSLISFHLPGSQSDSNLLAQINSSLFTLSSYEENLPGMSFDEWYQKCSKLPFFRDIGLNYKHQAIEWNELEKTIDKFIKVNTQILRNADDWLEDAPAIDDPFFTTKDEPLQPIKPFVQKLIVKPNTKIGLHGDFHGDVHSMIEYIQRLNQDNYMNGFKIIDPNFYLIFLGDYEDRGNYGAEVWYTLMRLKIENPNNVIIVRGNHEDINTCYRYGFMQECEKKFQDVNRFRKITRIFDFLPVALYLGSGTDLLLNYILCVHGGIETNFSMSGQEIKFNSKNLLSSNKNSEYQWFKFSPDNQFPTDYYIGFMWSDFNVNPNTQTHKSGRGTDIYSFSKEDTVKFLKSHSSKRKYYALKGIFRAHQHGDNDMMEAIKTGSGVARLWPDETNKDKNLWDNIVCTFLVGPDTVYGEAHNYNYDGFGILTTAEKFEDWKLDMYKNEVIPIPKN